jgi:hypothetical protein
MHHRDIGGRLQMQLAAHVAGGNNLGAIPAEARQLALPQASRGPGLQN